MMYLFRSAMTMLLVCQTVSSQTTPNLEAIFKSRCLDYNNAYTGRLISSSNVNCSDLWRQFSLVWAFKPPCPGTALDYGGVINLLDQTLSKNKALFWSGTKDLAHTLSNNGRRYVTLEDTLIGYLGNDLTWCGQTTAPGLNEKNCPGYGSCDNEAVKTFWLASSKWFAALANGEIQVLLNGSNPTRHAYYNESIFYSLEIPNLRSDTVTKVTAFVVNDLVQPPSERCGTSSLLQLARDLQKKNIPFDCKDNPEEVKRLLYASGTIGLINADGRTERGIAMLLAVAAFLFVKVASN